MNKLCLIGNLTREPEMSETATGVALCRFCLAVNRDYKDSDGNTPTDFFNITVWREKAKNCGKYLKKGSKVAIVGSIQNRTYEDKDGNKRTITDIVASDVEFLTRVKENDDEEESNAYSNKRTSQAKQSSIEEYDDDLPF